MYPRKVQTAPLFTCRSITTVLLSLLLLVGYAAVVPSWSHADEVLDSINEAVELYKKGDHAEAITSLDYASQLIRQKRGSDLQSFLPSPLPGWTAEEVQSQTAGAALFGGMVSVERSYNQGEKSITIKIVTDSPMMQGVLMMMNNPMIVTSGGGELQKIKGRKGVVKYQAAQKNGDINIVIANRILVTVEGQGVAKEDMISYASAVPFDKLESF